MYGKIFDSMYEGTLYGHWEAIVTLQQMLVLCNKDGILDMTPQAIAARTSIPLDIITKGIGILSEPDPYSRTPGEDGKRIILMDAHRPWGWVIVNYIKYRDIQSRAQKNEADRLRISEQRKLLKDSAVAVCSGMSQGVANVAHVDVPATTTEAVPATPLKALSGKPDAVAILQFLNEKTGKGFEPLPANLELIIARLKEASADDIRSVVAMKCREWGADADMVKFLRPKTLFGRQNFAQYVGELKKLGGENVVS